MKIVRALFSLVFTILLATSAAAQATLTGKWQGRLEAAPGQSLAIHFDITAAGTGYAVAVTAPDSGIRNVPATNVKYANDRLTFDVPKLSGGFAGNLRDGTLVGEWSQEGAQLPLTLRPEAAPTLSKAEIDILRGEWWGKLSTNGLNVTVVLRFTPGGGAEPLRAALDVPEQGVKDWEATNVVLEHGHFSVDIPRAMAKVTGTLKGEEIVGHWEQMGNRPALTLKKGRYTPPVYALGLTAAARDKLKGRWTGTLGPLAVVVRFETDAQGRAVGYFDSTTENLPNIPITEATFDGTKLMFKVSGVTGTYTGTLAGDTLTGEWTQVGLSQPVALKFSREK